MSIIIVSHADVGNMYFLTLNSKQFGYSGMLVVLIKSNGNMISVRNV